MWLGSVGFGFVADRLGRRSIFTVSLVWYSLATAVMAFQHSAASVDLWRFIAAIGVGLEQVTIDTLLPELVPPPKRGRAFAFSQGIAFCAVPVVALLGWLLVPSAPLRFGGLALGGADRSRRARCAPGGFAWACRKARAGWRCMARKSEAEKVLRRLEARAERDFGVDALPPRREPAGAAAGRQEPFRRIVRSRLTASARW